VFPTMDENVEVVAGYVSRAYMDTTRVDPWDDQGPTEQGGRG